MAVAAAAGLVGGAWAGAVGRSFALEGSEEEEAAAVVVVAEASSSEEGEMRRSLEKGLYEGWRGRMYYCCWPARYVLVLFWSVGYGGVVRKQRAKGEKQTHR